MAESTIEIGAARVLLRGQPGYEEARRACIWNGKKPGRFPDVIAIVASEQDVVESLAFAGSHGMKVAIRGGGHNMNGSAVRDGGLLVDLSQLRDLTIDPDSLVASVQPGISSGEFAIALAEHQLAFPVGHDPLLPMSGYLLSGGFGWNMGAWGPACFSIRSVDVVTANGDLFTVDDDHHPDLMWAARGAGAGFFAVATRFRLALHPLPTFIRMSRQQYPLAEAEEVGRWAAAVARRLPRYVEARLILESAPSSSTAGAAGTVVSVLAVAFADSNEEAEEALSITESCPSRERALSTVTAVPVTFEVLQKNVARTMPTGHRYAEDTLWSDETAAVLLPRLAKRFGDAPSDKSFVHVVTMSPQPAMPDAAFSMVARTFVWCCAVWDDETDDANNQAWLRQMLESVGAFGVGRYIAGADLIADPSGAATAFAAANWDKLRQLKGRYDPGDLFYWFLGAE